MPLRESRDSLVRATNVPVRVAAVLEVEAAAVADVALDGEGEAVGRREAGEGGGVVESWGCEGGCVG